MKETPLKAILDRNLYSVLIKENFNDTLELLEEVVNYGTNLIPRCFESSGKEIKDIVIIICFFKACCIFT